MTQSPQVVDREKEFDMMLGSDRNKIDQVTVETVRKAIRGAHIRNSVELYASYGGIIPQECLDAAEAIRDNYAEFEKLLWDRLSALPLTQKFFGHLIRVRLKQKGILASPIISAIFDDQRRLEHRLQNIQSIPGVEDLLLAEILVLDFLVQLEFSGICKVSEQDSKAHIDIVAQKDGKRYAIEVTRKKEIKGWKTLPYGNLEDCDALINQGKIRKRLRQALSSKEDQFSRSLDAGTIDCSMTGVVAIKTSDFGFAECINQAEQIARELLARPNEWRHVDCIWLVPNVDVKQSRWVCRNAADIVKASEI